MRISSHDVLATILVGAGVVIYAAWTLDIALPFLESVAGVALAILVLGAAASMSAVVPGFDELIHGSRPYMLGASLLGALALAAGIWAIVGLDTVALAVLVVSTVALWAISTIRHGSIAAQA